MFLYINVQISSELNEKTRKIEESQDLINQINNYKLMLAKQNEELKLQLEEESSAKHKILNEYKRCQIDLEDARIMCEDEQENSSTLQKAFNKSQAEVINSCDL